MIHRLRTLFAAGLVLVATAGGARAQTPDAPSDEGAEPAATTQILSGAFLPDISAASRGTSNGVGYLLAGYDGVGSSAAFAARAEAYPFARLALRVDGVYLPFNSTRTLQPRVELRWNLTTQARFGVDSSIGLVYRRDKITQDGGIVQAVGSVGRRFGRLGTVASLAYGQDDEGDDRLTELSAATFYLLAPSWTVGAFGDAATGWGSTDPRRTARDEASYEVKVGPSASFSMGRWALLALAGVDSIKTTRAATGVFSLAGIGSLF